MLIDVFGSLSSRRHKMNSKAKQFLTVPNIISAFRIVGTVSLFFIEPFSTAFFVVYTLCGLSDVLDGWIARATNTTSELGSKLDSVADLLLYAVMILRIFPNLLEKLPTEFWLFVLLVVVIRLASYAVAAIKYRRFSTMHTYLNKLTGLAVFTVPYIIMQDWAYIGCCIVAAIGGLSSLEELIMHIFSKSYNPSKKTLL